MAGHTEPRANASRPFDFLAGLKTLWCSSAESAQVPSVVNFGDAKGDKLSFSKARLLNGCFDDLQIRPGISGALRPPALQLSAVRRGRLLVFSPLDDDSPFAFTPVQGQNFDDHLVGSEADKVIAAL